jgi:hypothetical protein
MTANRLVVGVVALVALAATLDAVRGHSGGPAQQPRERPASLHIDLESATDEEVIARNRVFGAFKGVISKRAVFHDGTVAIGVSHVPGNQPPTAAVEVWRAQRLVRTFRVPPGSFARGLWFTDTGLIATIGWNGRGWLWSRQGRRLQRDTYFAYETG